MNKTSIEWCDYTWNPIVGCRNGCWYCYAKRMNDRFKWIKDWRYPEFFPERLKEPERLKKPSVIFVGSMCDIFSDGVCGHWVERIIEVCNKPENQKHRFMFLTKRSYGYKLYDFPLNCWLGATVSIPSSLNVLRRKSPNNKTFISFEPLMQMMPDSYIYEYEFTDLCIVGILTGRRHIDSNPNHFRSIRHKNIFLKDSIAGILRGYLESTGYMSKEQVRNLIINR